MQYKAGPLQYAVYFGYVCFIVFLVFMGAAHRMSAWSMTGLFLMAMLAPQLPAWWYTRARVHAVINKMRKSPEIAQWFNTVNLRYSVYPWERFFWFYCVTLKSFNPSHKKLNMSEITYSLADDETITKLHNFTDKRNLESPQGALRVSDTEIYLQFGVSWSSSLNYPIESNVIRGVALLGAVSEQLARIQTQESSVRQHWWIKEEKFQGSI